MRKTKKGYTMDQQIDRYLRGDMSSAEEILFLKSLQTDSELKRRAYLTALVIHAAIHSKYYKKTE